MRKNELAELVKFFGKRMLETALIAAWSLGTWALNEFVVKRFPLKGMSHLMYYTFEAAFCISALAELLRLIFWHGKKGEHYLWWQ